MYRGIDLGASSGGRSAAHSLPASPSQVGRHNWPLSNWKALHAILQPEGAKGAYNGSPNLDSPQALTPHTPTHLPPPTSAMSVFITSISPSLPSHTTASNDEPLLTMDTNMQPHGPSQDPDTPATVVMRTHLLGMDNRRAQNHILNSILEQSGLDVPINLTFANNNDVEDSFEEVELRIRQKINHVCDQMDTAGAAERMVMKDRTPSLPVGNILNSKSLDTTLAKDLPQTKTWEPPSPAKSSHSESSGTLRRGESDVATSAWLDDPFAPSEYAPSEEHDLQRAASCSEPRNPFFKTAICAALDTRTLVLLWHQGILGLIPGGADSYPALLSLDQLDTEILSTKLEQKESLALLYDLQTRLGGQSPPATDIQLKQCLLCEEFKLCLTKPTRELEVLHEFPQWKTKYHCAHKVCTSCTVKHMLGAFDDALWITPGGVKFRCPVTGCSQYLGHISKGGGVASYSIVLPMKDRLFMGAW